MSSAAAVDRADPHVLDTRSLAWEPHAGIPGGRMQLLARDGDGHPAVLVTWIPPGFASPLPERHYHRSVRERGYVLDGELAIAEFDGLDAARGVGVRFRAGFFMDRGPG